MISTIVLGGGCFWCLEAVYQQVKGVLLVTPGYAGGTSPNPTYMQVAGGSSGYAEVVKLEFDKDEISLKQILDIFWLVHDPTSLNAQGADIGSQYRSVIFYKTQRQLIVVKAGFAKASQLYKKTIVTEIRPLTQFYKAEKEHLNYYKNNPEAAYCQIVIDPKLTKLRQKQAHLLA